MTKKATPRVVELFAGVGGFRRALEQSGWQTVWANQWEPSTKTQHAFDCYVAQFLDGQPKDHLNEVRVGDSVAVNEDISLVLDQIEAGIRPAIPDHDLLVGGFPCQDYSVAKTLNQAHGIEGKKGVLWWSIYRILQIKQPRFIFLENVDRLLKSPASQRGRDFAIILACLADLGYRVEWRVVNASDYGFPQRRRRVFIVGQLLNHPDELDPLSTLSTEGILTRALPIVEDHPSENAAFWPPELLPVDIDGTIADVSDAFGMNNRVSPFLNSGVIFGRRVEQADPQTRRQAYTRHVRPDLGCILTESGRREVLRDHLTPAGEVPESFFISDEDLVAWQYLKGAKREERVSKTGFRYWYAEGAVSFPDSLDAPSRTILTGEGGSSPSRFKHVVSVDGRLRRLTPTELERLNGFPKGWTASMPDGKRAFMMGNALVVGLVAHVGRVLGEELESPSSAQQRPSRIS